MKIYLLIALLNFLMPIAKVDAQIRHVRGIKSVDLSYLLSKFGYGGSLSYVKYYSNSLYGRGTTFFEQGSDAGMAYRSIGGEVAVAKTIVHSGHKFYLNGLGGITFSIDAVVEGGEQFDLSSEFKTGGFVGVENELFINDRIVFVFSVSQRMLIREPFGNYRWFATGGIRFNL